MDLRERQGGAPPIRHPWERARARALERLLSRASLPPGPSLLDVGCGDGWLLGRLGRRLGASTLVGVDPMMDEPTRASLASERPPILVKPSLEDLPDGSFDLALLLDVVEHVEDDLELLGRASTKVVPGGLVLLTAPAHQALFGEHDRQLLHLRRYSHKSLLGLADRAVLEVLEAGSLFASLLLPRAASLLVERLGALGAIHPVRTGVGAWRRGPLFTRTILVALDLDNRLLSALSRVGLQMPGLSVFALCRKL